MAAEEGPGHGGRGEGGGGFWRGREEQQEEEPNFSMFWLRTWEAFKGELKRPVSLTLCFVVVVLLNMVTKKSWSEPNTRRELNMVETEHGLIWTDNKHIQASSNLYDAWTDIYQLESRTPPSEVIVATEGWDIESHYPPAPHLQDCELLTERRKLTESRGPNGEAPSWLEPEAPSNGPRPPWIKGADEDNLAMTRYTQALLWKHQHPANCRDTNLKFALVDWGHPHTHGLGSAMHVMSQAFAFVMESNRVLVPNSNFARAKHEYCTGSDYQNFECYYFPITDPGCKQHALDLFAAQSEEDQFLNFTLKERLASSTRVITITNLWLPWYNYWVPPELKEPWLKDEVSMEIFGKVLKVADGQDRGKWGPQNVISKDFLKAGWWRAQVVRYMLRWPTKRMCHAINRLRHEVYGLDTARKLIDSIKDLRFAVKESLSKDPDEGNHLRNVNLTSGTLDGSLWVEVEPYIPRPILSLHIRQSDKASEMHLFTVGAHMWLAARLRRSVPNLRNVWLTTETEAAIEETRKYSGWTFLHSHNEGKGRFAEQQQDMDSVVKNVFANWMVAAECDRFIGALASNFYRVINELRLTNGRHKAGVLGVNFDEC